LHHLIENYLLYADLQLMENNPGKRQRAGWQSDEIIDPKPVIFACIMSKAEKVQRQNDLKVEMVDAGVRISEKSLHKIVDELLDNAFKFSEPGTPIHITTEVNGHQWMLKITDQGRGMTTEQIAQIGAYVQFERHRYEQQGSGLGLTIAHLLTQLNGGELTIASVPQQGTTVTVVFHRK
jgi:two-component system sensor histidine kinase/response regulator